MFQDILRTFKAKILKLFNNIQPQIKIKSVFTKYRIYKQYIDCGHTKLKLIQHESVPLVRMWLTKINSQAQQMRAKGTCSHYTGPWCLM